ncbi:MAG: TlyA family RNA methyltransferase [Pontiellaceae bacterium]
MQKKRLDQLLVDKNLSESKEKAQRLIYAGMILVNDKIANKPGHKFLVDSKITSKGNLKFVGRGGLKLEEAYNNFNFIISNKICIDIGSSTGGFSDFLLQNNAKKIYAVDCGTNQLHWNIRNNDKVIVMEKTNARYLTNKDITEQIDLCVIDVSFISLKKIIPPILPLLKANADIITLIKPQFEAEKNLVKKGGVIFDKEIHKNIIDDIKCFCTNELKLKFINICTSPIKGPAGNTEFLAYWNL